MTQKSFEQPETFNSLHGLRFILALWISIFHFGLMYDPTGLGAWPIMKFGEARVDVFFVLSGFVLTHIYWGRPGAKFDYGRFMIARVARLMPLHLLALGVVMAMVGAAVLTGNSEEVRAFTLKGLVANVFMLQSWGIEGATQWNFPAWAVSAEFFGYLIFPLFLLAATRLRQQPLAFVAVSLSAVIAVDLAFRAFLGRSLTSSTGELGFVRGAAHMLVGVAGCVLFQSFQLNAREGLYAALLGVLMAGGAAMLGLPAVVIVIGGLLIVMGLASRDRLGCNSVLNAPVLVELGKWSYGIYILNVPVLMGMYHVSKLLCCEMKVTWLSTLLLLAILLPASAAAHYLVEEPARKAIRREGRRPTTKVMTRHLTAKKPNAV
ncbi:MAG: hypothetical protein RL186_360 [Pseudomonadota bacterium]